jgi:hypothetical protein
MRPHWWWRPGRVPGRRLYAWHLTFGDQTVSRGRAELRRVVSGYQARLAGCRASTLSHSSGCT